jgi:hypothetical protein
MTWRKGLSAASMTAGMARFASMQAVVFVLLAGLILGLVVIPILTVLVSGFQSNIDKLLFDHSVLFTLDNYRVLF